MLKRIIEIKNVGAFSDMKASQVEFFKLTLLYGQNCYGKSTLVDVLKSLRDKNATLLNDRKTLPNQLSQIRVQLNFEFGNERGDSIFSGNDWQVKTTTKPRFHVFDTGFIHTHLFDGFTFGRTPKENFTAFVLDDEGVRLAKEVEKLKQLKSQYTRDIGKLKKNAFEKIENLDAFIKLQVIESQTQLESRQAEFEILGKQQRKLLDNAAVIKKRDTLKPISFDNLLNDAIKTINQILGQSKDNVHKAAKARVENHIEAHLKNQPETLSWLQQGVKLTSSEKCPFCSQSLSIDAMSLLEAYRQSFDKEFDAYVDNVKKQLPSQQLIVNNMSFSELAVIAVANLAAIRNYPELLEKPEVFELMQALEENCKTINNEQSRYKEIHKHLQESLRQLITEKMIEPQKAIELLDADSLMCAIEKLSKLAVAHNSMAVKLNTIIDVFKQSLDTEKLEVEITNTRNTYKTIKLQLERVLKNDSCEAYKNLQIAERDTESALKQAKQDIDLQQSLYLNQYFSAINHYFQSFGSRDFSLEKKSSGAGNAPVYYLGVNYKGEKIDEKKLGAVFSESDRRALALAVFWAKLDNLSSEEKSSLIVVLDDPVTSFDDHRITNTLKEIAKISDEIGQLILLSHYKQCLTAFLNTYSKKNPALLQLAKNGSTSVIEKGNAENFLFTEHQKKFKKIQRFIERRTNIDVGKDLRIFLEEELVNRFRKQISDKNISLELDFNSSINEMRKQGIISENVANELHEWREILNTEHHSWTARDEEDIRQLATDLMSFIYHKLVPDNTALRL